jgi:hypothetical protein
VARESVLPVLLRRGVLPEPAGVRPLVTDALAPAHVAALPGNPHHGHPLDTVIPAMEQMIGNTIERVEPVIRHLKTEHRMGCNHLAHRAGDAINAMLAAVNYNFHILLRRFSLLLRACSIFKPPKIGKFTDDEFDGQREELEHDGGNDLNQIPTVLDSDADPAWPGARAMWCSIASTLSQPSAVHT